MDKFTPTPDMISAARAVLLAEAFVKTVKPIVKSYQKEILKTLQAPIDDHWIETGMESFIVMDPKHYYLMSDTASKVYYEECNKARIKAGLKVETSEHCPLLVAEDVLCQAQRSLVDSMESITHITHDKLFRSPNASENYDKYIRLTMRLLTQFVVEA